MTVASLTRGIIRATMAGDYRLAAEYRSALVHLIYPGCGREAGK